MELSYIGENIKRARIAKNIPLKEFVKLSGLSDTYYRKIEKGTNVPRLETIIKIADILDVSLSEILENNPKYNYEQIRKEFIKNYLSDLSDIEYQMIINTIKVLSHDFKVMNNKKIEYNSPNLSYLGTTIKEIRNSQNLSQKQISNSLGLSTGYYSHIEGGDKIPKTETFIKLANTLKVSTGELLDLCYGYGEILKPIFKDIEELDNLKEIEYKAIYEIIKILSKYLNLIRECRTN